MEADNYYYKLKRICKYVFLILFLFGISTIQAQQSGKIKGTVTDVSTGDVLIGANVILEGTSMGAAVSFEGEYDIRQVPPGDYNLIVRYIGYQEKKLPITVKSGLTLEVNFELEYVTIEGEEVVVSAQAIGQIGAINQQLSSNTITNVVSADRIKDIPDANAAESVGRLPGISIKRSGGEGQKVTIRGLSPKYNVVGVNGVRMQSSDPNDRSVDLNMISPSALSGIEVKKALTADMDADAVGGTVDLKISKAPEVFKQNYTVQGGYAGMSNDNQFGVFKGNISLSNRFFDNKLGIQATGFYQSYDRSSDKFSASWAWNGSENDIDNLWLTDVVIKDDVTNRKRYGGSLVLDYQLDNGFLMYTGFASNLNNNTVTQANTFGADDKTWSGYATDSESNTTVFSNAIQGEFDFDFIKMDFTVSHSLTQMSIPDQLTMSYGSYNGGSLLQGWTNPDENTQDTEKWMTPVNFINTVVTSTTRGVKAITTLERDNEVAATTGALNFEVPFNFGDYLAGSVEFGGKFERNTRKNDETVYTIDCSVGINSGAIRDSVDAQWYNYFGYEFTDPDGNHMTDSDYGLPAQFFMDTGYDVGDFLSDINVREGIFTNLIDISRMRDIEEFSKHQTIQYNTGIIGTGTVTNPMYQIAPYNSLYNDYNYTRDFQSYYLMTTLNIGKYVTFIPGIRYEKYSYDYTAWNIVIEERANYPGDQTWYEAEEVTWNDTQSENWFPQIQLKIKPTDWLDLRLASTKSIIYPDYRAVSPYLCIDNFNTPDLELGNPYLKPAITQNYDLYASFYDNYIGLFTAGYFYKKIDNLIVPIYFTSKDASTINNRYDLVESARTGIDTWINLEDPSYVKGFELDWQTRFWYLPEPFNGLVFSINYTKISSESYYSYERTTKTGNPPFYNYSYIDTTRQGRLVDQPDDILNLTIGFDYGDFSARLSYLYQDDVLEYAHAQYSAYDEHTQPYSRWDFTAYQKLPWVEGMQVFLNINNLTNEADLRYKYQNTDKYLSNAEYYGMSAEFGLRYSL